MQLHGLDAKKITFSITWYQQIPPTLFYIKAIIWHSSGIHHDSIAHVGHVYTESITIPTPKPVCLIFLQCSSLQCAKTMQVKSIFLHRNCRLQICARQQCSFEKYVRHWGEKRMNQLWLFTQLQLQHYGNNAYREKDNTRVYNRSVEFALFTDECLTGIQSWSQKHDTIKGFPCYRYPNGKLITKGKSLEKAKRWMQYVSDTLPKRFTREMHFFLQREYIKCVYRWAI